MKMRKNRSPFLTLVVPTAVFWSILFLGFGLLMTRCS